MSNVQDLAEQVKSCDWDDKDGQKNKAFLLFFEMKGKKIDRNVEVISRGGYGTQSFMHPIKDAQKRSRVFGMHRVHQGSTFVIKNDEEQPRKDEEKRQPAQDEKG